MAKNSFDGIILDALNEGYDPDLLKRLFAAHRALIGGKPTVRLIAYDIRGDDRRRGSLLEFIKTLDYVRLSDSAYAVLTALTSQQLFQVVNMACTQKDRIVVIRLNRQCRSHDPESEIDDWMGLNLE